MRRALLALLALFVLLAGAAFWLRGEGERSPAEAAATVTLLLGDGDGGGFEQAMLPGGIELPRDHGPHDDYRTEWWYFTGNLSTPEGREFGFQLTFFRFALGVAPLRQSGWASNQVYMAHFALTDKQASDHRVTERFARSAAGLAGVQAQPFRAWLDDWSARSTSEKFLPLELKASDATDGIGLSLSLAPGKPPVLQGENGLSAKGTAPGNASWYYSYTRMPATGFVVMDGQRYEVSGLAWLDREWSTSSLDADVVGWDWFSLQLEDGRDLMLYSLRQQDGTTAPQSAGSLVSADGARRALRRQDFVLEARRHWRSPHSGVSWPVEWRVMVPGEEIDLDVKAAPPDQEQNLTVRYWEGTVDVYPAAGGSRTGRGYMELTGYRLPPAKNPR